MSTYLKIFPGQLPPRRTLAVQRKDGGGDVIKRLLLRLEKTRSFPVGAEELRGVGVALALLPPRYVLLQKNVTFFKQVCVGFIVGHAADGVDRGSIRGAEAFHLWVGMGWGRLGWVGLGWVGLGWVGLGWVGLGWDGLGWVEWVGLGLGGVGGWVGRSVSQMVGRVDNIYQRSLARVVLQYILCFCNSMNTLFIFLGLQLRPDDYQVYHTKYIRNNEIR